MSANGSRSFRPVGHGCIVVAPSLIPVKTGNRVKTDRRDAMMLAKLHRAGELTAVRVPDVAHEAMRVAGTARQHLQGFLLRHGRVYPGRKGWAGACRRWLAVADAGARVERLTGQIADLLPQWSLAPVVAAVQAMRGVGFHL